jgi:hypothetical protein
MGIFLTEINKFVANTEKLTNNVVKEVVTEITASLVELSPVDTGNFVSNWLIGIDSATPWGVTGIKNPDKEFNIDRIVSRIPMNASNHIYKIVNNTKYAELLEHGHSGQAPNGMVGVTMVRIPGIIRRVIRSQATK